ncbi:MAG: putative motility protein [Nitrospinae bacterium]|nr:putative motility protein [Nitrospinota bacterium]
MSVSGASSAISPAMDVLQAKEQAKAGQVQTSVAKKTLDQMKAEGAQLVDMIQKAGSVINTVA